MKTVFYKLVFPFNFKTVITLLLLLITFTLFFPACSSKENDVRGKFKAACPQPEWWDDVSIEGVTINSFDDMLTYWQNNERINNQFFKAAYQAILDHPLNDNIVVNAINLMPYADRGYRYTIKMLEFAVDNYFDYERPLANYGGKSGDAIGGIVENLSGIYNGEGNYSKSIDLIKRLLEKRESEINDNMLELISLNLADAYYKSGEKTLAIETLQGAVEKYNGNWEKRLKEQLQKYEAE